MTLQVICSMATQRLLQQLLAEFNARQPTSQLATLSAMGGVLAETHIRQGNICDVVVLAENAMKQLTADGYVANFLPLLNSPTVVAVAEANQRIHAANIATLADLQRTLSQVATIGYSTGPSGQALLRLFSQWGIKEQLQPKLRQASAGIPVGKLLQESQAEIGFQQLSELQGLSGVRIVGGMPPGAEINSVFAVGIHANTTANHSANSIDSTNSAEQLLHWLCHRVGDLAESFGMSAIRH